MTHLALIAIGSNLNQPEKQVQAAFDELARLPESRLIAQSALYRTKPVGYTNQPDFINAAALLQTHKNAQALLSALQAIEHQFGRERSFSNAPRTLDLDLIDFNHQSLHTEELTLPHPRAKQRAFVLLPLHDIDPNYLLDGQTIATWIGYLNAKDVQQTKAGRLPPLSKPQHE